MANKINEIPIPKTTHLVVFLLKVVTSLLSYHFNNGFLKSQSKLWQMWPILKMNTTNPVKIITVGSAILTIKHKIVVMSGKGGVGKSTVAANIAETLQRLGFKTGILDADIHGPNIPKMLGIEMLEDEFNQYQFDTFKALVE